MFIRPSSSRQGLKRLMIFSKKVNPVKGIGKEYSELLEKAGVDTVKELRNRNPENLLAKLEEANSAGRQLVRALPALKTVASWVETAKTLDPMVTH